MKKHSFLLLFIIILLSYLFHGHIYFVLAPTYDDNSRQNSKNNILNSSSIENNSISLTLSTLPLPQSLNEELSHPIDTEFNLTSYILSMPANKSWFYSDEVSYQMNYCQTNGSRWTTSAINNWYSKLPRLIGCNFIPSTAINPIEMWAADTFDTRTIEKELRWAFEIFGINSLRVYLHFAPFEENPSKFIENIHTFLHIADTFSMNVLFVLFDDCWRPVYSTGVQPKPKTGIVMLLYLSILAIKLLTQTMPSHAQVGTIIIGFRIRGGERGGTELCGHACRNTLPQWCRRSLQTNAF